MRRMEHNAARNASPVAPATYFPPAHVTRARVLASVRTNAPHNAKPARLRPLVVRDSRSFA